MIFDIITIFPSIFDSYFNESIIKRARAKKYIDIRIHNLRDWTADRHKTVDDEPYGGGPGMVMRVEPIFKAVNALKKLKMKNEKAKIKNKKSKTILFSVNGKKFNQKMARQFAKLDQLIMICGRYEGVDERVAKYIADMEVSVGDYVLTGGEIPAMIVVDAVSRLVQGVIKGESIEENRFRGGSDSRRKKEGQTPLGSYPVYTRPEVFLPKRCKNWRACPHKFCKTKFWRAPKILLSGNHKQIEEWQHIHLRT